MDGRVEVDYLEMEICGFLSDLLSLSGNDYFNAHQSRPSINACSRKSTCVQLNINFT